LGSSSPIGISGRGADREDIVEDCRLARASLRPSVYGAQPPRTIANNTEGGYCMARVTSSCSKTRRACGGNRTLADVWCQGEMRAGQKTSSPIAGPGKVHAPCCPTTNPNRSRAHAILLLDQAGWHGAKAPVVPSNVSLVPLPPRAPELNARKTSGGSSARIGCQSGFSHPPTIQT
jgi:hypothetical protein